MEGHAGRTWDHHLPWKPRLRSTQMMRMLESVEPADQLADKAAYFKHRPSGDRHWPPRRYTGDRIRRQSEIRPIPDRAVRCQITNDFPSANARGASASFLYSPSASAPRSPSASVGPDARDHSRRRHL